MKRFLSTILLLAVLIGPVKAQSAEAIYKQALESFHNGEYKKAIQEFTQVLEMKPNDFMAYQYRGEAKSNMGEDKAAIVDYNEAIKLEPTLLSAYILRGNSRAYTGNDKGAIQDYDRVLNANPNDLILYAMRATSKLTLKDYKGAIEDYSKFLDHTEEWPNVIELSDALINRGLAKHESEDKAGACEDWEKARHLGGYDALALLKKKCDQPAAKDGE